MTTFLSGRDCVTNSHEHCAAFYLLPSTNTCLLLYLKLDRPTLNEPLVLFGIHQKWGLVILLKLIRYECSLNAWVNQPFLIQILFQTDTEPIILFNLGFVLKMGLVLPLSIMEMGSFFVYRFSSMDPDANERGFIYYRYDPYFLVFL